MGHIASGGFRRPSTRKKVAMMVSATSEVVRIMGVWVRRADAGLASAAARNAATSMAELSARRFEAARTLRDLNAVFPTDHALPVDDALAVEQRVAPDAAHAG
jgi:hypothetical protein